MALVHLQNSANPHVELLFGFILRLRLVLLGCLFTPQGRPQSPRSQKTNPGLISGWGIQVLKLEPKSQKERIKKHFAFRNVFLIDLYCILFDFVNLNLTYW